MIPVFDISRMKVSVSAKPSFERLRSLSRILNPRLPSIIGTDNRLAVYEFLTIEDWMTYDADLGLKISKAWKEIFILQPPEEQLRQATELVSGAFNPPNYWEDYREENAKYGRTIETYMDWFYNNQLENILNIDAINWWGVYSNFEFILPMDIVNSDYHSDLGIHDQPYLTFVSYVE